MRDKPNVAKITSRWLNIVWIRRTEKKEKDKKSWRERRGKTRKAGQRRKRKTRKVGERGKGKTRKAKGL